MFPLVASRSSIGKPTRGEPWANVLSDDQTTVSRMPQIPWRTAATRSRGASVRGRGRSMPDFSLGDILLFHGVQSDDSEELA